MLMCSLQLFVTCGQMVQGVYLFRNSNVFDSFISIFLPIIHSLNNPPYVSPLHQIKINMSFSKRPIMMEISCEIGNKLMQRRRYICGLFRQSSVSQRHGVMSQQPNSNCNEHRGFRLTPAPSTFLLVFLHSSSSVSFITTEI